METSKVPDANSWNVPERFSDRHIGPDQTDIEAMLQVVGHPTLASLAAAAVPATIAWTEALALAPALSEHAATARMREMAAANRRLVCMIGLGYHDTVTPAVIRRNVLESPGWYTSYTAYQPEISQGRLEALLNYQTMVADLTGLPIANASLLDEPTAAGEAMALLRRVDRSGSTTFIVDTDTHPQTLAVLATRAAAQGIALDVRDVLGGDLPDSGYFGVLISQPTSLGRLGDPVELAALTDRVNAAGARVAVAADPLALCLLVPPGEWGADVVIGSAQRFGVPMGFGGPHAGYIAVRSGLERQLPGRLVGVSVDSAGRPALRLALQTREQHIRRERATSNICTAQVLLAVVGGLYAAYHGPQGLRRIAARVHRHAVVLAAGLSAIGVPIRHERMFDTVTAVVPGRARDVVAAAVGRGLNLRLVDEDHVGITTDEVTEHSHVEAVWAAFGEVVPPAVGNGIGVGAGGGAGGAAAEREPGVRPPGGIDPDLVVEPIPEAWWRTSQYLTHPVFHAHRSETQMLRYLRRLSGYDVALDRSMIPLGSCTMKLNATTEMEPITWPGFADLHPFAPDDQVRGYRTLLAELEAQLVEITGYDAVSLQPNAGSQGEFAGLLAIRAWQADRGEGQRDVCLIPSSAHGTNAASAALAGLRVVVVACDDLGNITVEAVRVALAENPGRVAAIMITYPSTHGVYEPEVAEVCRLVHAAGGQVYVDGANLNALVGLAKLGRFGADVSHLNLHKTFCVPHGGGGPGVGPLGVRAHLARYLPSHPLRPDAGPAGRGLPDGGVGPVSGAPWGSAGILPISWAYIAMMGGEGLTRATQVAVLSANYVARRLSGLFPVLYTGTGGLVAHECVLDLRAITKQTGITVDDVAKRLVDFGLHAPTTSFPVPGTLMVEPTESEPKAELDRFCEAMIAIRAEIQEVAEGRVAAADSVLRGAPHTAESLVGDWDRAYSREQAVFPVPGLRADKYWPPVGRIDGAHGDRHLVCACPLPDDLA
ncbi:MAG: glycine dehydrogenase (aminomethyl-transferring) [Candidatus Nanopelagicales bacterium]